MRHNTIAFFALLIAYSFSSSASAQDKSCSGRFVNPVTDLCWACLMPITIGGAEVHGSDVPDTENPTNPVCACNDPVPRVGITLGFWEPVRLVDVTRHPYCFPNLGGMQMDVASLADEGAVSSNTSGRENSFYHVHWYIYPVLYWLNLITDVLCVETGTFDVGYLTELDPTWNDDELSFILNPEAILFSNPTAQAACAADCTSANISLPQDKLFWCAGCQGSMYPLSGHVQAHVSGAQASTLLLERMTYKLHREGILWGSYGEEALCANYPMPVMNKSQYRYQMTYPIPTTTMPNGCSPYGRSTVLWESGKEYPVEGEDFGYLVWRKKSCCAA